MSSVLEQEAAAIVPLYKQLPRGPSQMSRAQVAGHQRARLHGAMIRSVALHGYEGTTIALLVGYAGVSRRALYEQFDNKHQCFLSTHDAVLSRARLSAIEGWRSQRIWSNSLHAACRELFDLASRNPRGAHLLLVDSIAVQPGARERTQRASLAFERMLGLSAREGLGESTPPRLSCRAIVGGIRQMLFVRIREERHEELRTLAEEALDWIEAYRSPRPVRAAREPQDRATPPAGPPAIKAVSEIEERVLRAMARLVDEVGFEQVSSRELARQARLPSQSLHRLFGSRHDCFMALIAALGRTGATTALKAAPREQEWPQRVCAGLHAYLDWLAANPIFARVMFLRSFELGEDSIDAHVAPVAMLLETLMLDGPAPRRGVTVAREAILGALWSTIFNRVAADAVGQLPALSEQLSFLVLAPFVGAREAHAAIAAN